MSDKTTNEFLGKSHPFKKYMARFKLTSEVVAAQTGLTSACVRNVYRTGIAQRPTIKKLHKLSGIREDVLMYPGLHPDFDVSICNPPNINASVNC